MNPRETTGYLHSVETMGTLDGPGTRCVVFLQGCPLRCAYCHNPDTWKIGNSEIKTAGEIVDKIIRYKSYFGDKGGITISGGDPLAQAEFTKDILLLCKKSNIHTALDTAGSILNENILELLEFTDLVLLDIKHCDSNEYKKLTGGKLKTTLDFLEIINAKKIPFWVRQVIVPQINDSPAQIQILAQILQNKPSLERIELLAYHDMGYAKWRELGLDYKLKNTLPPTQNSLNQLREILNKAKLPIKFPE